MGSKKIKKKTKPNLNAHKIIVKFQGRVGFGLHSNTNELLYALSEMSQAVYGCVLVLDFMDVEFFYPSGLNSIVTLGSYLIKTKSCFINHLTPRNDAVNAFLIQSGFDENTTHKHKAQQDSFTFGLRNVAWANPNEISGMIDVIEQEVPLTLQAKNRVFENIAELINNVRDHAESPINCFIIGQAYPRVQRIRYCVGDAGIGIKTHLTKKYPELKARPTWEVIKHSTEYGITGSANDQNSGLGLYELKTLVRACGGSFCILSEDGFYEETVDPTVVPSSINEIRQDLDFYFHGTVIDIILSHPSQTITYSRTSKAEIPENKQLITNLPKNIDGHN